ncbi:MAG: hypothetical protein GXP63_05470 [DPANN group archaeon]|nr:hypothetical protein [DPANN group archaeon]
MARSRAGKAKDILLLLGALGAGTGVSGYMTPNEPPQAGQATVLQQDDLASRVAVIKEFVKSEGTYSSTTINGKEIDIYAFDRFKGYTLQAGDDFLAIFKKDKEDRFAIIDYAGYGSGDYFVRLKKYPGVFVTIDVISKVEEMRDARKTRATSSAGSYERVQGAKDQDNVQRVYSSTIADLEKLMAVGE